MNLISVTLNYVCLFFFFFLVVIYFSKKKNMTVENIIYIGILLCTFGVICCELLFLYSCFYLRDSIWIMSSSQRISSTFLNIFFMLLCFYAIFICTENNIEFKNKLKSKKKWLYLSFILSTIIIFVVEFILPLHFEYNNGIIYYAYGPALDGVSIAIALIDFIIFLPIFIKNRKNIELKKLSPILIATILELITLIVSGFTPYICLASISLTATCYIMYMTIENPDLKLIKELELAKNQAEKASQAKSDFLSSMSHELRTPLNAIVGLSQMIQTTTQEEETKNDINDIMKASKNLLELVDGILDINKLETNEMKLNESNYNPREIFDDLGKMIKIRIGDKPIEYRARISDSLPTTLYGDKDKIKSIILNLLTNAVKYTDQGYIDFVVDSMNVKGKCNLRISVSDTGRGIAEDQMPYMFTKFYRREEDKDSDIEGTGLGLAITKSLVDLMDGKITINSSEGMGSTFLVILAQEIIEDKEEIVETL